MNIRGGAERQTDGHIANSLLLVGINLGVLPFRSDQDKFSVGAERNGKLMDTLPIGKWQTSRNLVLSEKML